MPRLSKCKLCNTEIQKNDEIIYIDETYKKPRKIKVCSQKCCEEYANKVKLKLKEKEDYKKLCEYIMQIHKQDFLPDYFYILLTDLRNGTIRQKGIIVNKKKEGVSWEDILNAYKYCEKDILHILDVKKDFGSFINELKYCLAIVKNNMINAKKYFNQKEINDNLDKNVNVENINNKYTYKKKEFKNDISNILD